ncbi:uncharacterized protein I303_103131 [Kwoniella dejecticola CBS 10117]|uniref:HIT domain-containing protein n=1 Tax=Kwoniella dejecticola CBS 10117 TaxID=1296121 RepID=A0A1A6AAN3_9TREE|nr:uncharacterized protein I303_03151 [Kwoniella dejecticola CBS 10117]OBR87127.1 hypothetical protein I303_03151 [Kwoniella dejecticola CBS 10117]
MPTFLSCFPSRKTLGDEDSLAPLSGGGCIFCNVSKEKGFNIVYEDEELIAFHDRTPRAKVHLLIIPRRHLVSSVKELRREHIPLLNAMTDLASTLVPSNPPPKTGFHIPPFSSVPHLHLHVFSGKHTFIGRFKYPISGISGKSGDKGYGWFVTPDQVIKILHVGKAVGLGRG